MALTDTSKVTGTPVEWGSLKLLQKIQSIDGHKRDVLEDTLAHNEKVDKAIERSDRNNFESFMYEFRDDFKETFKDVNTSNMDMKKDLRKTNELKIKGD